MGFSYSSSYRPSCCPVEVGLRAEGACFPPLTLPPPSLPSLSQRELKKEKERQELWRQLDELQLRKLQGLEEAKMNRLNLQHSLAVQRGEAS